MSYAKGNRIALVRRCIEGECRGLLNKHYGDAFNRIVSEFYNNARHTTMRSRPWALGKALARLRGKAFESRGFVETPNAFWSFERSGQGPMSIVIRTKDGNYLCRPYCEYHVSAGALADIDSVLPEIIDYLKEDERKKQVEQIITISYSSTEMYPSESYCGHANHPYLYFGSMPLRIALVGSFSTSIFGDL